MYVKGKGRGYRERGERGLYRGEGRLPNQKWRWHVKGNCLICFLHFVVGREETHESESKASGDQAGAGAGAGGPRTIEDIKAKYGHPTRSAASSTADSLAQTRQVLSSFSSLLSLSFFLSPFSFSLSPPSFSWGGRGHDRGHQGEIWAPEVQLALLSML
jgi:hypothetical protein